MRRLLRALNVLIAGGAVLTLEAPAVIAPGAPGDVFDEIVIAHRSGSAAEFGEGTMLSYQYSVANLADILDGDISWTKDGTIIIMHDSTLDEITNCSGKVSDWLWTSIRDNCLTDVGKQPLVRLEDLVAYANSVGKRLAIELKQSTITNAQAKQLWNTIKSANVQLESPLSRLSGALDKVKALDQADPDHEIEYGLVKISSPWPSVSKVKSVGTYLHAGLSISKSQVSTYQANGIKVFMFTGKNEDDYAIMASRNPDGVVIDDLEKYRKWRNQLHSGR
jgi:glycerophosphoryl diester phosphodiesterase